MIVIFVANGLAVLIAARLSIKFMQRFREFYTCRYIVRYNREAMDNERLIRALDNNLPLVATSEEPDFTIAVLLNKAYDDPTHSDPLIVELLGALRAETDLEPFNGNMQVVAGAAMRVELTQLGAWLLHRAQYVGADQAVANLHQYLTVNEIDCEYIFAISGITLQQSCYLAPDLELRPWNAMPESKHKLFINDRFASGVGIHRPTAALIRRVAIPKIHVQPAELRNLPKEPDSVPRAEVEDALLCIGLFGPIAPYILATWIAPPDWAPILISGYEMPFLEGHPKNSEWPIGGYEQAPIVFQTFTALDTSHKARWRLAMQRLNKSIRRFSTVDAAIDLGIVLETLFLRDLSDDRGEITFRLRVRAARYLDGDLARRYLLFKLVGDLYSLRSTAIHTGQISESVGGAATTDLLNKGFELAATTIIKFILEGEPDWKAITLA